MENRHMELKNHPRWKVFAQKLADAIAKSRKINSKSHLRGWADSFHKLHTIDGVPTRRILEVLSWYCRQLDSHGDLIRSNNPYLPIAYSGKSFREKFLRIEDAMIGQSIPDNKRLPAKPKQRLTTLSEEELAALEEEMGP